MDLEKRLYDALKSHKTGKRSPKPNLFAKPPIGIVRETDSGPIWMVETTYDEGYLHGRTELEVEFPVSTIRYIDPSLNQQLLDMKKVAVIDTETTGLAGGTGTYPFILGVGYLDGSRFVVRQYILRDFSEEPAQLEAFTEDLNGRSCLLTYNGKSFDVPLLRTRFRINRMPIPFADFPHLDLVHPCRRLFKHHFDNFQLSFLEAMIVGFERVDDVPSHLIPYIYFDFLQSGNSELLLPILNHNRDDIVSLYLLNQAVAHKIELAVSGCCEDDSLLLSLAGVMFQRKDFEQSLFFVEQLKTGFAPEGIADEAMFLKSRLAKKQRDWQTAVGIWKEMISSGRFGCHPHIELAKHLEHREKAIESALATTTAAMRILELERELGSNPDTDPQYSSLRRRHRRLTGKLNRISK